MAGWYNALPVFAQNLVCDAYGVKMQRERFNSAFRARLHELRETEWWPAARIAEYQDAQVRKLVKHAYDTVPFYRARI